MPRTTDKERVKQWQNRVISATKAYTKWADKYRCKECEEYWQGHQWASQPDDLSKQKYVINLIFPSVEIKIPSLLFYRPQVKIRPRPGRADDQQSQVDQRAKLQEDTVNTFFSDKRLRLREETTLALRGGWLYTGDIVRMDEDGYFFILDRKKEMIKHDGFQVWPREVEEVIRANPKVLDVAVAGIPDTYHGEAVKAWILVKPGRKVHETEIKIWCRERLAPYKTPSRIEFLKELPRSTVGKVVKRELVNRNT